MFPNNQMGLLVEDNPILVKSFVSELEKICEMKSTKDLTEALAFIANNNTELAFFVVHYNMVFEERLISFVDKVDEINPFILKIIIDCKEDWIKNRTELIKKYNIIAIKQNEKIENIISNIKNLLSIGAKTTRRHFSRIDWPLSVKISFEDKAMEPVKKNILSISGNGAFIHSENYMPLVGQSLTLTISFKDFKLFTKADVVWLNDKNQKQDLPIGFAVIFTDIGPASQKVIDNIIKDKLVKRTLFEFKSEL